MQTIKLQLLENAVAHSRTTKHGSKQPLFAAIPEEAPIHLLPLARYAVPTGISIELPPNIEALVTPLANLVQNDGLTVLNNPGTIDPDYRGQIFAIMVNLGSEITTIRRADHIADLRLSMFEQAQFLEVTELTMSARSNKGLGSTGTR